MADLADYGHDRADFCPDCGEPLYVHRGVIPLTATRFCPSCQWCEVVDGDRQANAEQDWYVRNVRNRDENKIVMDEDIGG